MRILNILLDFLFPKLSLLGAEGDWITFQERQRLTTFPVRLHKELLKKQGTKHLDCLIAAGTYKASPLLRKAILTFKYGRVPELHHELSRLILEALPGLLFVDASSPLPRTGEGPGVRAVLCPVPLHWTRKFHRGFNQAELLARDIANAKNWPMQQLLKRTRPTGHQARRTKAQRLRALTNAFRYSGPPEIPSFVLLVDDLCTTGATLDECAKALKEAGVKRVEAIVVAHG